MKKLLAWVSAAAGLAAGVGEVLAEDVSAALVHHPETSQQNPWYPGNRPPLQPLPFVKLPTGAITPRGWLRRQFELDAAGMAGNLPGISPFLKEGGAWASPTGEGHNEWEEPVYWLCGYAELAYVLNDPALLATTKKWVEAMIASQQPDGYFGPRSLLTRENGIPDPNEKHRHVSHLWALHPGAEITPATPDLFKAAKTSLLFRGNDGVEWSLACQINFWARLLDGDHAYQLVQKQLNPVTSTEIRYDGGGGAYPNLLCACPPFQIDGNLGYAAGIAEMLLQSHAGEIVLLPALPKAWPSGSVSGLRARSGFTVDIEWKEGKLTAARIHSASGNTCKLRCGDSQVQFKTQAGESYRLNAGLKHL